MLIGMWLLDEYVIFYCFLAINSMAKVPFFLQLMYILVIILTTKYINIMFFNLFIINKTVVIIW